MSHISEAELKQKLKEAKSKVILGATYHHYKSKDHLYKVTDIALLEEKEEPAVIYKAQYGDNLKWIRPISDFLAEVEVDGKKIKRFTLVG